MTKRNEPCPCGSGRKYKYCCLHNPKMPSAPHEELGPAALLWNAFKEAKGDAPLGSIEKLNEELGAFVTARNTQPLDDFLGLSPDEMHALQHNFFGTVHVADRVATVPPALPLLVLEALLEAGMDTEEPFDELPDAPLDLALERIASTMLCQDLDEDGQVHLLDMAFLVLRTAGIVRRDDDRFSIDPQYSEQVQRRDYGSLYPLLFQTLSEEMKWGFSTPAVFEPFFGFTLFQLHHAQGADTPLSTFLQQFYDAFPMVFDDLVDDEEDDTIAELLPIVAYFISVVVNYWGMLGLVEEIGTADDALLRPHSALQELLAFPDGWEKSSL